MPCPGTLRRPSTSTSSRLFAHVDWFRIAAKPETDRPPHILSWLVSSAPSQAPSPKSTNTMFRAHPRCAQRYPTEASVRRTSPSDQGKPMRRITAEGKESSRNARRIRAHGPAPPPPPRPSERIRTRNCIGREQIAQQTVLGHRELVVGQQRNGVVAAIKQPQHTLQCTRRLRGGSGRHRRRFHYFKEVDLSGEVARENQFAVGGAGAAGDARVRAEQRLFGSR